MRPSAAVPTPTHGRLVRPLGRSRFAAVLAAFLAAGASSAAGALTPSPQAERAGARATDGEVLVSAAASLADVLATIARAFEASGGGRVTLNLAASNAVVRQVRAGAPVDVVITADEPQLRALGSLVREGSRVTLASNQLAVVVPDDRPAPWSSISGLLDPAVRRIAVGDPAAVPAGVYAREYLSRIGLWARIQPRLVPTGSVRLALAAVETAAADAAIVYRTDAKVARRAKLAWLVPVDEGPVIAYIAASLRAAPNATGADRFLRFLSSEAASAAFASAGFGPSRVPGSRPGAPAGAPGAQR